MNATQAENLRILIRHMETKCNRVLDMSIEFNSCGTPACAYGEAHTVAALKDKLPGKFWYGAGEAFGEGDRYRLFGYDTKNAWGRDNVTPQEWAVEARKVLAENGYSMDEVKPIPTVRERLDAIYAGNALTPVDRAFTLMEVVGDRHP